MSRRPRSSTPSVMRLSFPLQVTPLWFIPPYWQRQRCQVDSVIFRWGNLVEGLALPQELLALGEQPDDLFAAVSATLMLFGRTFSPPWGSHSRNRWISSRGLGQALNCEQHSESASSLFSVTHFENADAELPRGWIQATAWVKELIARPGSGPRDPRYTGGSQPHLFDTSAGHHVVKLANNPQGPQVLTNELVAGRLLEWLGVDHPPVSVVRIDPRLIAASPGATFHDGTPLCSWPAVGTEWWQSEPIEAIPADRVRNVAAIAGTLVFDTWIRNFDGRQYRVRPFALGAESYDCFPVDQGFCFGNPWTAASLNADRAVAVPPAVRPTSPPNVLPFVNRLQEFTARTAEAVLTSVPDCWMSADQHDALKAYLVERAELAVKELTKKLETGGTM